MEIIKDTYNTIEDSFIGEIYKEKGSKFIGFAFPVKTESDINKFISEIKTTHYKARHWCYAWQIGDEKKRYRANDDGEPNNSAGQPIYGQILSFDLTNILIIVVRYYGGTKLGVGGLISAYKTAAKNVLENANIVEKTIDIYFGLTFDYKDIDKVMRKIKEFNLNIISQKMELNCNFALSVRKKHFEKVRQSFKNLLNVKLIFD
jgi:uncharacterized YigZ family protein